MWGFIERNWREIREAGEEWRGEERRGEESGEERITRDERNREERIIGGRDERAESKTASKIEMGREKKSETDGEVLESSGAGSG